MARKGETTLPEVRKKIGDAQRGRRLSEETKEKLRQAHLGQRHSEETKRKISQSNTGKKMSDESRAKMRAAKLGTKRTEAARHKQSESARGKPKSVQHREQIGAALRKRYTNPVYAERQRAVLRAVWEQMEPEERRRIALHGRIACHRVMREQRRTTIEIAVADALRDLGITFEEQVTFRWYLADIYLPDHNIVIECDGDYWHSLPKIIAHDRKRDAWFESHQIRVIRIKETDIRQNAREAVLRALEEHSP